MDLTPYQELDMTAFYGKVNLLTESEYIPTVNGSLGYERTIHITLKAGGPLNEREVFSITNTTFNLFSVTMSGEQQLTAHVGNMLDAGVYKVKQFTNPVWIAPGATVEYTPLIDNDNQPFWVVSGPEDPGLYESVVHTTRIRRPIWIDYDSQRGVYRHPEDNQAYNHRLVMFNSNNMGSERPVFSMFDLDRHDQIEEGLSFHVFNNLSVPIQFDYGLMRYDTNHTSHSRDSDSGRVLLPGHTVEIVMTGWEILVVGDTELVYD